MNMKSLDRMQLVLAGFGLLTVIVALGGYLLVVSPQSSRASSLSDQIATKQIELAGLHTGSAHKPDLHAAQLFQLSRALPDEPDQAGILMTLAQLAQRAGVTLAGVQPQATSVLTDGATAVPMAVIVQGKWGGVTAFLAGLRKQVTGSGKSFSVAGRLFDVDQVQITSTLSSSAASTPPTGVIQATLTLDAFVYGTAPAPTPTTTTGTSTTTTTSSTSSSQVAAGTTGGS